MRYIYQPGTQEHYATDLQLREDRRILEWRSNNNQDVLIIQTPYGKDPREEMTEICSELSRVKLFAGSFQKVTSQITVCYITAREKVRKGGCPLNGEASTYMVFPCVLNEQDDICDIYAPPSSGMTSPRLDIPMKIFIDVSPVMRRIFIKEIFSGFYQLSFPKEYNRAYRDGDLEYQTKGFSVPITRQMLENGFIYVKTDSKPKIISNNSGVLLAE